MDPRLRVSVPGEIIHSARCVSIPISVDLQLHESGPSIYVSFHSSLAGQLPMRNAAGWLGSKPNMSTVNCALLMLSQRSSIIRKIPDGLCMSAVFQKTLYIPWPDSPYVLLNQVFIETLRTRG